MFRRPRPERLAVAVAVVMGTAFGLAQTVHGSGPRGYRAVQVVAGDTLWSIAARAYPDADPRIKVDEILQANHLTKPVVYPGQTLRVPVAE